MQHMLRDCHTTSYHTLRPLILVGPVWISYTHPCVLSKTRALSWKCIYRWLDVQNGEPTCPVCKSVTRQEHLIPLYGRGADDAPVPSPDTTSQTSAGPGRFLAICLLSPLRAACVFTEACRRNTAASSWPAYGAFLASVCCGIDNTSRDVLPC